MHDAHLAPDGGVARAQEAVADVGYVDMANTRMSGAYSLPVWVLQALAWLPGRFMLHYFLHLRVRGTEHLKSAAAMRGRSGVIFACSHVSEFDPIIVLAGVPPFSALFPMFYASAPVDEFNDKRFGIRRFIYKGLFFKSWGAYPFVRGLRDYENATRPHVALLRDGRSLCVFPTGGIDREGAERKAHGGIAYIAEATDAVIVPVHIERRDACGVSFISFLARKHYFSLTYGPPLRPQSIFEATDQAPERYKCAAERIVRTIETL